MKQKKRVVVVCPGRGSYTKDNLQTLRDRPLSAEKIKQLDLWRRERDQPTLTDLDSAKVFKTSLHTKGEHASSLIYGCAMADFLELQAGGAEIVGVTGNSMGWYLALAFAEALDDKDSFDLIDSMGSMMKGGLIGGQIIYPIIKDDWTIDKKIEQNLQNTIEIINQSGEGKAYISIRLGGYRVIAGDKGALKALMEKLPKKEHYPFQLVNHGAFHSPLLDEVSDRAFRDLKHLNFSKPRIPMIDGRGHFWKPHSTDVHQLRQYTLGHQVTETYDFSKAIEVAIKELAPDHLVLLGPGNSLGGAIGQALIANNWRDISSKDDFSLAQKQEPFLISMSLQAQRKLLT